MYDELFHEGESLYVGNSDDGLPHLNDEYMMPSLSGESDYILPSGCASLVFSKDLGKIVRAVFFV